MFSEIDASIAWHVQHTWSRLAGKVCVQILQTVAGFVHSRVMFRTGVGYTERGNHYNRGWPVLHRLACDFVIWTRLITALHPRSYSTRAGNLENDLGHASVFGVHLGGHAKLRPGLPRGLPYLRGVRRPYMQHQRRP